MNIKKICVMSIIMMTLTSTVARAGSFWENVLQGSTKIEAKASQTDHHKIYHQVKDTGGHGNVQDLIRREFAARVGSQWVPVALHIAKIESGYRCQARNGRAHGVFQILGGPMSCEANIHAAVHYANSCIARGARNANHMMACWNSGSPFTSSRKLEHAYRTAMR